jgi:hypothetical protein
MTTPQGTLFKFELDINETNLVLGALGAQPYNQVSALIAKIQEQAKLQIETSQTKPE